MWTPIHRSMFFNRKKPSTRSMSYDGEDDDDFLEVNDFLLREPVTRKLDNENIVSHSSLEIGHSSMQGYRKQMEDKHIIADFPTVLDHTLVAVMDGHSGSGAAILTSKRLLNIIENTTYWKEYVRKGKLEEDVELISKALIQAFIDMDDELRESPVTNGSGCTCVCAVISPKVVVCASVGDSRCVIGAKSQVISMSEDHKPSLPEENERIVNAGGMVMYDRVNGELAMSRALGDFQYKNNPSLSSTEQLVICIPDVSVHKRSSEDEMIVLACDGVWDVMSNSDAINFLSTVITRFGNNQEDKEDDEDDEEKEDYEYDYEHKHEPKSKRRKYDLGSVEISVARDRSSNSSNDTDDRLSSMDMAEALIDLALLSGSTDNLSSIVVRLQNE